MTARYAKNGTVLERKLTSNTYATAKYGEVPVVNSVAVRGADGSVTIFVVNRSLELSNDFEIQVPDDGNFTEATAQTLHEEDLLARNTLENQDRVILHTNDSVTFSADDAIVHVTLPPVSWTAVHVR